MQTNNVKINLNSINNLLNEISSFNSKNNDINSEKVSSLSKNIFSTPFLFLENLLNNGRKWAKTSESIKVFLRDPDNSKLLTSIDRSKIISTIKKILSLINENGLNDKTEQFQLLYSISINLAEINSLASQQIELETKHEKELDEFIDDEFLAVEGEENIDDEFVMVDNQQDGGEVEATALKKDNQNEKNEKNSPAGGLFSLFSSFASFSVFHSNDQIIDSDDSKLAEQQEFEQIRSDLSQAIEKEKIWIKIY